MRLWGSCPRSLSWGAVGQVLGLVRVFGVVGLAPREEQVSALSDKALLCHPNSSSRVGNGRERQPFNLFTALWGHCSESD